MATPAAVISRSIHNYTLIIYRTHILIHHTYHTFGSLIPNVWYVLYSLYGGIAQVGKSQYLCTQKSEQGITIDVAYRYFATPKRKFIVARHTTYPGGYQQDGPG